MKKTLLLFTLLFLFFSAPAQKNTEPFVPHIIVKWAPTGLLLGSASMQAEYNFGGRNSLTAKIGLPVNVKHTLTFDDEKAGFNMKATSFLAGYRTYFSKKHLKGFYYEPFFSYVNHTSEGTGIGKVNGRSAVFNFTNNYSGAGVGIQLGAQFFIGKRLVIDWFFLGPAIASATNNLKAVDASDTHYWTSVDAKEAERHVRDFLDQFPVIGRQTNLMVDKEMKQITAVYKGALPGLRTGVSIGFSF